MYGRVGRWRSICGSLSLRMGEGLTFGFAEEKAEEAHIWCWDHVQEKGMNKTILTEADSSRLLHATKGLHHLLTLHSQYSRVIIFREGEEDVQWSGQKYGEKEPEMQRAELTF